MYQMDPNGVGDCEVLWFFSTAAWKVPLGCAFVRLSRVDQAGASPRPTKVVLFPFIHPVVVVVAAAAVVVVVNAAVAIAVDAGVIMHDDEDEDEDED